nr:hypothetical protein [Maliibacterium massiliense]
MSDQQVYLGCAQADITPQASTLLVGFDRPDNRARGVLAPLIAQVALWRAQGDYACIVAIDSLGFTVALSNQLRAQVARALGAQAQQVMLCFSHTHSAPNAAAEPAYYQLVCQRVLAAVRAAQRDMEPVHAGWGVARADIGVNRRDADGPLDRRVGVLRAVEAGTGREKLLLVRLTAHANVVCSDNLAVSPDYFGVARALLTRQHRCMAMLTQGASGDVRPRFQQENALYLEEHAYEAARTPRSQAQIARDAAQRNRALEAMAHAIAQTVRAACAQAQPAPIVRLRMFSQRQLFFSEVPDTARAHAIAKEAWEMAHIDGAAWLSEVARLQRAGITRQQNALEVQYLILNDGCLCGVAEEAMNAIALDAAARAGSDRVFFGGYTNGCSGYLPTAKAYAQGGYEVLWSYLIYFPYHGRVMALEQGTALRLAQAVADVWRQARA